VAYRAVADADLAIVSVVHIADRDWHRAECQPPHCHDKSLGKSNERVPDGEGLMPSHFA